MKHCWPTARILFLLSGGNLFFCAGPALFEAAASPPSRPQENHSSDFAFYRSHVEPIFLKHRDDSPRCYDCHSTLVTKLALEPLATGASSWTEAQSLKNYRSVKDLLTPGDPLHSRLLLHPLAHSAGGDPAHTGGKFWQSQSDPEWQLLADWVRQLALATAAEKSSSATAETSLSFETYKRTIEPIFLKQRLGHARCYSCHDASNRIFRLQPLSAGASDWSEQQSRENFQSVSQLVSPGEPSASPLLAHPTAPEAGGDSFHSGGRQFSSYDDPDYIAIAEWIRNAGKSEAALPSSHFEGIYVTNSAGNTVDVIDPASNSVVQVIRGIELPHGVNFSPDGSRVYISNEAENVLDVVDRKSTAILQKIPLSGRPNNLAITRDGGRVLVGIRSGDGAVDIVDTHSLAVTKTIPIHGSVHNIFVTPDGLFAVTGSIEAQLATVIDLQKEEIAWELKFDQGVRPLTFDTNADGSTRRMFVQLNNVNGFAVVDFARRVEIARILLPKDIAAFGNAEGRERTPSHGIRVSPDGKFLWLNSTVSNATFKYSLPDLLLVGFCKLPLTYPSNRSPSGSVPDWLAFSSDGSQVYVSNSATRSVSVIDAATLQYVKTIPVGEVPKRLNTLTVP